MEGQRATKRPRRIQQRPAGGEGKRKLVQETASPPSPPENKRSRKGANLEAERLLDSDVEIGDAQMLQVLRLWKFSENATRTNVTPRDAAFVPSDTLGEPASDVWRTTVLYCHPATWRAGRA